MIDRALTAICPLVFVAGPSALARGGPSGDLSALRGYVVEDVRLDSDYMSSTAMLLRGRGNWKLVGAKLAKSTKWTYYKWREHSVQFVLSGPGTFRAVTVLSGSLRRQTVADVGNFAGTPGIVKVLIFTGRK